MSRPKLTDQLQITCTLSRHIMCSTHTFPMILFAIHCWNDEWVRRGNDMYCHCRYLFDRQFVILVIAEPNILFQFRSVGRAPIIKYPKFKIIHFIHSYHVHQFCVCSVAESLMNHVRNNQQCRRRLYFLCSTKKRTNAHCEIHSLYISCVYHVHASSAWWKNVQAFSATPTKTIWRRQQWKIPIATSHWRPLSPNYRISKNKNFP